MVTRNKIAKLVSDTPQPFRGERPAYLGDAPPRPASVLMLFAEGGSGLEILLTKRAQHLRIHAGQVSFPGGKPEANDDSPAFTALREAKEETGLLADLVTVEGYLPPVLTNTNYMVDLTVGFCHEPVNVLDEILRPAPEEVEEVWFAPANPLVQLDKFEKHALIKDGQRRQYWQVKDSQPMIWGATAAMLRQLAILLEDAK